MDLAESILYTNRRLTYIIPTHIPLFNLNLVEDIAGGIVKSIKLQ